MSNSLISKVQALSTSILGIKVYTITVVHSYCWICGETTKGLRTLPIASPVE
jgi:hypothetical protein